MEVFFPVSARDGELMRRMEHKLNKMPGFYFVFFTDLCACMSEALGTEDKENVRELRCVCVCV